MGIKYLWDTNTVIYYLQQQFPPSAEKIIDELLIDSKPSFSVITEIELLCWKTPKEKDLMVISEFISNAKIFELENPIKLKTADLRKLGKLNFPMPL